MLNSKQFKSTYRVTYLLCMLPNKKPVNTQEPYEPVVEVKGCLVTIIDFLPRPNEQQLVLKMFLDNSKMIKL